MSVLPAGETTDPTSLVCLLYRVEPRETGALHTAKQEGRVITYRRTKEAKLVYTGGSRRLGYYMKVDHEERVITCRKTRREAQLLYTTGSRR